MTKSAIQKKGKKIVEKSCDPDKARLELFVNNPDQASPSLTFGWCLNEEGVDYLRQQKVIYPFLLVVVVKKAVMTVDYEYARRLYPLDLGLGYIQFDRPGEFLICATVVWSWSGRERKAEEVKEELYEQYVEECPSYLQDLYVKGVFRVENLRHPSLPYRAECLIRIDENQFASEPSPRLGWWVNLFWDGAAPKNQLGWYARMGFAFSVQPIFVLIFLVCRSLAFVLVVAWFLLIGIYPNRINWRVFIDPYGSKLKRIVNKRERWKLENYWWHSRPDGGERSLTEKVLLSPLTILVVALVMVAMKYFEIPGQMLSRDLSWPVFFLMLALMTPAASFLALWLKRIADNLAERFFAGFLERKEAENEKRQQEKTKAERRQFASRISYYYDQRVAPLACAARKREATLEGLPKTHRSWYLRLLDLKARLFKPYRRD